MAEAKVFGPDDRLELIDGEVFEMAPIGSRHAACVRRLVRSFAQLGERAIVSVQDPIELSERSEPQPDVTLLRPADDFYAIAHPAPADVLLAVEVADTTLAFDLERKAPLYLAAGISELWVIDVVREVVHVATPAGSRVVRRGESLAPQAFPDLVLEVSAIVG